MKREDAVQAFERIGAAANEIAAVARIFQASLEDDGSKPMILACGRVLASMHHELLVQIFTKFPDLEAESRKRLILSLGAATSVAKP